jgi:hypothetical protein
MIVDHDAAMWIYWISIVRRIRCDLRGRSGLFGKNPANGLAGNRSLAARDHPIARKWTIAGLVSVRDLRGRAGRFRLAVGVVSIRFRVFRWRGEKRREFRLSRIW